MRGASKVRPASYFCQGKSFHFKSIIYSCQLIHQRKKILIPKWVTMKTSQGSTGPWTQQDLKGTPPGCGTQTWLYSHCMGRITNSSLDLLGPAKSEYVRMRPGSYVFINFSNDSAGQLGVGIPLD